MKPSLLLLFIAAGTAANALGADVLGLRNFRELPAAFEAVTGISAKTASIDTVYRRVLTRLPLRGTVEEVSSPMILAVTELAGAFCSRFIYEESRKAVNLRRAFSTVDFAQGPAQFDAELKLKQVDELALLFWQRPPTPEERQVVRESLDAAATSGSAGPAGTMQTLQVACAQIATSLQFLIQ